jgi:TonB family protein
MFARFGIAVIVAALTCTIERSAGAESAAIPSSANIIEMEDLSSPPAGAVAPRPISPHDISMANYPRDSFIAGEEGNVKLRLLVRDDGSVEDAQIESSSGSARLDQAAVELVRQWHYDPATRNGSRVAAKFPVVVIWKLLLVPATLPKELGSKFYPQTSARLAEQGAVTLRFLVMEDGTVPTILVEKSSGHLRLDDAAIQMVKYYWHFKPASLPDGSTVGVWVRTEIGFRLR